MGDKVKPNTFSKYLRSCREKAGLSQLFVSRQFGFTSPQFISNWERGLSCPSLRDFKFLADMYGVDLFEFVDEYKKHAVNKLIRKIKSEVGVKS